MVKRINAYDMYGNALLKLVQYDHDVYVYIKEKSVTEPCPVHFSNTDSAEALVVDNAVYENGVLRTKIPNVLLEQSKPITGWVYIDHDGGNRTTAFFNIDIIKKPVPSDWISAESDDYISAIAIKDELLKEFNKFIEESREHIGEVVAEYFEENPIVETDPTVPSWAKQPEKPVYTAEEIGLGDVEDDIAEIKSALEEKADKSEIPEVPVTSVNGKTGDVQLTAADVGALSEDTVIPPAYDDAEIKGELETVKNALDDKADKDDIPEVPVASVNGKTGAVVLNANDVGALPSDTVIPPAYDDTDIKSELDDVKDTLEGKADKSDIPDVPVVSVNGKIGAVILNASDVGALPNSTVIPEAYDDSVIKRDIGDVKTALEEKADKSEIPTIPAELPSPGKLIFTGATTAEYDGSGNVTVNIPTGNTEDSVTEQTIAGWGFTKFDGNYNNLTNKPEIPEAYDDTAIKEDISDLQDALDGKADKSEIPDIPVSSVNGKTGVIVLTANDVGALPSTTVIPEEYDDAEIKADIEDIKASMEEKADKSDIPDIPVTSVNGKTGAVQLTAADVGALSISTVIPEAYDDTSVKEDISDLQEAVENKADKSEIPNVPVLSVNGKTGDIQLSATDVGALPSSTVIPPEYDDTDVKKDIEDIKGALDDKADKSEIPDVPVASVNGKTGSVVLNAADVGALPSNTVIPPAYDDTDLRSDISALQTELDKKTDKVLLAYDGTHILKPDGGELQFEDLYAMLMDRPNFVVLVYNNRAYHPNQVSAEQVVFVATYSSSGYIQSERITMLASGAVTTTFGTAEKTSSRVNAITGQNKNDEQKYPSLHAVSEYVDAGDRYSIYYEDGDDDDDPEYDEPVSLDSHYVTPEMFGAVGNGVTDDTNAIQAALDTGSIVEFAPNTVYKVRCAQYANSETNKNGHLVITRPVVIHGNNATLDASATLGNTTYTVLRIRNTSNVTIEDLNVVGDEDNHPLKDITDDNAINGAGQGIYIDNSSNVTLRNVDSSKCFTDGLYVRGENIRVYDSRFSGNGRQGCSVTDGKDVLIEGCEFSGSYRSAPRAGLDIEPSLNHTNSTTLDRMENIVVRNCRSINNAGAGFTVGPHVLTDEECDISVDLINCTDIGSGGFAYDGFRATVPHTGHIMLDNCTSIKSRRTAFSIKGISADNSVPYILNNCKALFGNTDGREDAYGSAIMCEGTGSFGNLFVYGFTAKGGYYKTCSPWSDISNCLIDIPLEPVSVKNVGSSYNYNNIVQDITSEAAVSFGFYPRYEVSPTAQKQITMRADSAVCTKFSIFNKGTAKAKFWAGGSSVFAGKTEKYMWLDPGGYVEIYKDGLTWYILMQNSLVTFSTQ